MAISETCWCIDCDKIATEKARAADPESAWAWGRQRMNLCPECGNKRCPRSSNHTNACTGSNELGQPGSYY